ncbi:hypothetical protein GIB67_015880 [Kingdonia uniflora]|uniref:Ribosomal RNA-processing protein 7 C-terminal domain-containing protein n=1 Tax=Kingdonia uniflora TaxID=39325 RepID=A0A7J7NH27_9MAGN|nr:hypothetical protein GIB67_015880 [Kingdonia uniflora]
MDRQAYGGIFRLYNGIPIVAFNIIVLEDEEIEVIITKAICDGLRIAATLGFRSLCILSVSEFAVKVLNGIHKQPWACIPDMRDAKEIITNMDSCLIANKKREGNKPAEYISTKMDIQDKIHKSIKAKIKKKKNKLSLRMKGKKEKDNEAGGDLGIQHGSEGEDDPNNIKENMSIKAKEGKKKNKLSEKRRKNENEHKAGAEKLGSEGEDGSIDLKCSEVDNSEKPRKAGKREKSLSSMKSSESIEKISDGENEVYHVSSGDDDSSKGMKKWVMDYYQSRPGLTILHERIDEFIVAHEEQEEQAKIEREARVAEGGWTVVAHHKGRKKSTDAESGIAVGSVSQASVLDKMAKKKHKDVGLDFYRFQKREAQRTEVMMLQVKFEQHKKRIQQLRAARKFKPY